MDDLVREFIAEASEGLEALDCELVRFEQTPDDPQILGEVFRLIHTIKGACGFLGLVRLQALAHAAETVLGGFRDGGLTPTPGAVTAILETLDGVRAILGGLARDGVEPEGDDSALIERLEAIVTGEVVEPPTPLSPPASVEITGSLLGRMGGDAVVDAACETTVLTLIGSGHLVVEDRDTLQAFLHEAVCTAARDASPAAIGSALAKALGGVPPRDLLLALVDELGEALLGLEVEPPVVDALTARLQPPVEPVPAAPPQAAASPAPVHTPTPTPPAIEPEVTTGQTIRVSVDALEHMMTVVSELVLIRNQLLQLLRLEPESPFAAPLHRLNQVTSELQEGVMTTRMQPINGAWAKLPRLVRDLATDLGKRIELTTKGQNTELDRQVLELIKDPLTHMVRNACDHGLETPGERRAAGKPEAGRIALSAYHESGAIVIEMTDDGRGLNAARIRAKAVENGLVSAQQAQAMSDAEAHQLIFAPGFSTAEKVTSVSGRGVGMDVVRTNIERIGGTIDLWSAEGQGTRFTIHIPLTLTIISALVIECCGERFAMPQSSVIELVSASNAASGIEYINGAAVMRLRDRLLPLVSLQTLLGLPVEKAGEGEACIVVARVGAFSFGVMVDKVFDTEEIVVKPVSSVLRHLKLYSGATILGDGAVIMILDFKGMAHESGAARVEVPVEEDAAAEQVGEQMDLLLFRAGNDTLKAVPLASVARIEEIDAADIERVDGRSVLQYRGQLMPAVGADGAPAHPNVERPPLLVFARGGRSIGLVVDEIIDIVTATVAPDLEAAGEAASGSLIVAGQATELIDIDYYWRRATGERPPAKAVLPLAPPPVAEEKLKQLLLVDASPFSHLLLRPLLAQAGYRVTVAETPEAALRLHDEGERFDLIMADTSTSGPEARRFAMAFSRASEWHTTPLLALGLHKPGAGLFDETTLLDAVSDSLDEPDRMRA